MYNNMYVIVNVAKCQSSISAEPVWIKNTLLNFLQAHNLQETTVTKYDLYSTDFGVCLHVCVVCVCACIMYVVCVRACM